MSKRTKAGEAAAAAAATVPEAETGVVVEAAACTTDGADIDEMEVRWSAAAAGPEVAANEAVEDRRLVAAVEVLTTLDACCVDELAPPPLADE